MSAYTCMHVNRHVSTCQGTRVHLLNPLSLTPSRLPRFSANEERPFPHAFSRQKGKNMGESYISEIQFSDFRCIGGWHRDRWKGACGGSDIAGGTTLNNYTLNS